jgi:electron transport complex protein RnfD
LGIHLHLQYDNTKLHFGIKMALMQDTNLHIELRTSPHLKHTLTVGQIMRNVVIALLPVCAWSIYSFGISALLLIVVTTAIAILTEHIIFQLSGNSSPINDWSVTITGMLLALTLPPGFPLWMAAIAAFVGVALGKALFGGLGHNVMNPALVGRAFVQAAFPVAITTWTPAFTVNRFWELIPSTFTTPFMQPPAVTDWIATHAVDGFTGATPLALQKFQHIATNHFDLFIGTTTGSTGETSALIILLCGIYLVAKHSMDWRLPMGVFLGAIITSAPFWLLYPTYYPNPLFMLLSGGLMLGAVFMASDMVASPVTPRGIWIYGLFIGAITIVIRLFAALPEGVMYAILLGNVVSPLIAEFTQPRVYGQKNKVKEIKK